MMLNSKAIFTTLTISFLIFSTIAIPAFAIDYNPGVSKGQYIKYDNFIGIGPGLEPLNNTDWIKQEITSVSGKEITLLTTGQFKDGTATPGNGSTAVWNIETGTLNQDPSTQGPIIATNLNQGDSIPPPNTYTINKTETRTYLGVARSVNILDTTISTLDYSTTINFIYDKSSGMLLEASSDTTLSEQQTTSSRYSYSIAETNIFNPAPTPAPSSIGAPVEYLLIVAIIFIVIIVAFVVFKMRTK